MKQDVILIGGPTAVGKSQVAVELAKQFKGEIISADSMQIYKRMSVGTAKITNQEMNGIPHHMIDFIDPKDGYSVSEYRFDALSIIKELSEKKVLPIVVGGTGLYLNALLYEMDFSTSIGDVALRQSFERIANENGEETLHEKLKEIDPQAAQRIHPHNVKKVIRALEINSLTGKPFADFSSDPIPNSQYNFIFLALNMNRKKLYARINRRVENMIASGLVEEVTNLKNSGLTDCHQSMKGIGYKEVLAFLNDDCDHETMVRMIKLNSRRYAKRQVTWLRRYPQLKWFDVDKWENIEALCHHLYKYIEEKRTGGVI